MRFIDAHLHLDSLDARDVIGFATSVGATLFACGVDRGTSAFVVKAAAKSAGVVRPFVGVHPSEAMKDRTIGWLGNVAQQAAGVGEIGLDPSYSSTDEESAQMTIFRGQLEVAERAGKPVQVHSRNAEKRVLEVLGTYHLKSILMHWLENGDILPMAGDRGCYISFGPALLYSKRLQQMALRYDPRLVLVESDSPVTFKVLGGVRGPSLVPSAAFRLAELWGKPFADTLSAVTDNSLRYVKGSSKG